MADTPSKAAAEVDVVIVGAGFAGLYMLHRLRGLGFSARVFEAATGVGGTWYWNRYPGARCDVESLEYSYTFSEELDREWRWTERYASQPEILRYLNHVADRFDLRRDIQFETTVTAAVFAEAQNVWNVETSRGERVQAKFCIMATGCLSSAKKPDFKGLEDFAGKWYQTSHWPHEGVDFSGQRVAVIGTGSSAIQAIPIIAEQAAHLFVFQRTPNYSVPARNGPITPEVMDDWNLNRARYRQRARASAFPILSIDMADRSALATLPEERERAYEERWQRGGVCLAGAFSDLIVNQEANDTAAEFVRAKIRETARDPAVAEKLAPKDYPFGTKRLCVDTGYYATFNRENVSLIDLRCTPIEAVTPQGLRTSDASFELDSIVFATGFDAMTGALTKIDIRGNGGVALKEKWSSGPRTFLGIMTAGFPNLFTITGPGSPSVLSNMVVAIEQHADWIASCLTYLRERQLVKIEATEQAENEWVAHVNEVANATLYPRANSWYVGANVPGKPRVFMPYIGGFGSYSEKCDEVAEKGYAGFALSAHR
ncbi:MAG TPA: NAD(P)/FAD-dependent oxidoreductase [Bryobacteraceae bacterium]|nr:NAD(P)/FAD-dependent oxidoreductase [Bryobacteraceae bacterium]